MVFDQTQSEPVLDCDAVNAHFTSDNCNPGLYPFINSAFATDCVYSFATTLSPNGLFLCLKSGHAASLNYLDGLHHNGEPSTAFLQIKKVRTPRAVTIPAEDDSKDSPEPKRLAIGVEGGFDGKGFDEEDHHFIALRRADKSVVTCPLAQLKHSHLANLAGHILAVTATDKQAITAWEGDKRDTEPLLEHYPQAERPPGSPDVNLKDPNLCCQAEGCDKCDNLWLNLGTGHVLCGRKYYDGTGGNNHAIEHFQVAGEETARFSIKIGTICADLEAIDVYDYKADKFVKDPWLDRHLKHWGVDHKAHSKTEKTVTEMEIDLNKKLGAEWDIIQENGKDLQPAVGSWGIENLGSTCYMGATIQALAATDQVSTRFGSRDEYHALSESLKALPVDVLKDHVEFQTRKLFSSVINGPAAPLGPDVNIRPRDFKVLIGKDHVEFKTWTQQDAQEWFTWFLDVIDDKCRDAENNPSHFFKFKQEERLMCKQSQLYRVTGNDNSYIQVPVRMEDLTKDEVTGRESIAFAKTLHRYFEPMEIEDFLSSKTGMRGEALKYTAMKTFPDLLMVQLGKFYFDSTWQPKKYNVEIDVPHNFDLCAFKDIFEPLCEDQMLPENLEVEQPKEEIEVDMNVVNELVQMGMKMYPAKRAVHVTGGDLMEAVMWLTTPGENGMTRNEDPAYDSPKYKPTPSQPSASQTRKPVPEFDPASVGTLTAFTGLSEGQAKYLLKEHKGNVEAATNYYFENMGVPVPSLTDEPMDTSEPSQPPKEPVFTNGVPEYTLRSFISHMGSNATAGHYVAHVRKDINKDEWVIVNDDKACISQKPPFTYGYLYIFERKKPSAS